MTRARTSIAAALAALAAFGCEQGEAGRGVPAEAGPGEGWRILAAPTGPAAEQDSAVLVLFGDSMTTGFGLDPKHRAATLLEEAWRARPPRPGLQVSVIDAGVSGETALSLIGRLDHAVPSGATHALIAVGYNDMSAGREPGDLARDLHQAAQLLQAKGVEIAIAGGPAPDWVEPAYADAMADAAAIAADLCGCAYVADLSAAYAHDRSLAQADGVHPNEDGAARLAERLAQDLSVFLAE